MTFVVVIKLKGNSASNIVALQASMRIFPPERSLMMRERSAGLYRVGPYFLAKSVCDMALYTVGPTIYATVVYWIVGLRSDARHFFVFIMLFMAQVREC